jgi:hypothetical protein
MENERIMFELLVFNFIYEDGDVWQIIIVKCVCDITVACWKVVLLQYFYNETQIKSSINMFFIYSCTSL